MRVKLTAIIPKRKPFPTGPVALARIEAMLDDAATEAQGLYAKTTSTWKTRVNFYVRKTKAGRSIGTRSKVYAYVDKGTRPHIIKPKGNYPLAFSVGGRPKTRPNYIASYGGQPGKTAVFAREVHHPGAKARGFTAAIQKRMTASMKRRARLLSKELARG